MFTVLEYFVTRFILYALKMQLIFTLMGRFPTSYNDIFSSTQ